MNMKYRDGLPAIFVFVAGLFLGWSISETLRELSRFVPEAGHYRIEGAFARLEPMAAVPAPVWIAGGALGCLVLWSLLRKIVLSQERTRPGPTTALAFIPILIAAIVMAVFGDITTQGGRFWLVASVGLATAGQMVAWVYLLLWPLWDRRNGWLPGTGSVWAISLGLYIAIGLWTTTIMEPTGDEPHYFLAMHSLVHDGDLDLSNNHEQQDYLHFYPTEIHNSQMIPTTRGIVLPKHSLGLTLVGAPFYYAGGRMAVGLFAVLPAAMFAVILFNYMSLLMGLANGAKCWSIVLLSSPLVIYPGQIYPNVATGLLIGVAMLWSARRRSKLVAGVALGLVPWFHLGTWPLAVAVLLFLMIQRREVLISTIVPAAVLWSGLFGFHLYFWGSLTPPVATYGSFSIKTIPAALAGLFLDQEAGLVWISPIWIVCLTGLVLAWKTPRFRGSVLLLLGWLIYVSTFDWWYGGWCPTGRFLLPALTFLCIPLCLGVERLGVVSKWLWLATGLCTITLVSFPFFRYNAHDGSNSVLDAAGSFGKSVAGTLPSVVNFDPLVWGGWIAILGVIVWFGKGRSL